MEVYSEVEEVAINKVEPIPVSYNAKPINVQDRDSVKPEKIEDGKVSERYYRNGSVVISTEVPELFKNLRTVILGRDVDKTQKHHATKSLLHNYKNGSIIAAAHAEAILIELLTHERMRG